MEHLDNFEFFFQNFFQSGNSLQLIIFPVNSFSFDKLAFSSGEKIFLLKNFLEGVEHLGAFQHKGLLYFPEQNVVIEPYISSPFP